ncbi:MAG: Type 1 glutamine amidotransferase-like domain-containing protein [archaeon]|jgi:dipeptidase E
MKLFLASAASRVLDKIKPLLPKAPKDCVVAFIPTASDLEKDKSYLEIDKAKLREMGFKLFEVDLKYKNEKQLLVELKPADIIFVAGGSSYYLLGKVKESGFDKIIKLLLKEGKIYVGSSAGAVIASPNILTITTLDDRLETTLESSKALGLVDFLVLPHFEEKAIKNKRNKILKEFGSKFKIEPITNQQVIIINNGSKKIIFVPKLIPWVGCAIIDQDKLLILWKKSSAQYEIPGGKLESNESLEEGAKREVLEEIGCKVEIIKSLIPKDVQIGGKRYISHNFIAKLAVGENPKINEPKKFSKLKWLKMTDKLEEKVSDNVKELCELYKLRKL